MVHKIVDTQDESEWPVFTKKEKDAFACACGSMTACCLVASLLISAPFIFGSWVLVQYMKYWGVL